MLPKRAVARNPLQINMSLPIGDIYLKKVRTLLFVRMLTLNKIKLTSNFNKCLQMCNKISKCGIKRDRYFVDEVKTHLREKPLRGSQTQDIHYSEDKTSYKVVALT